MSVFCYHSIHKVSKFSNIKASTIRVILDVMRVMMASRKISNCQNHFWHSQFFQVSVKRWCKTNQWNGTRPKWKNNSSGLSKVNRERERNLSDWRWRWERESGCACEEKESEKCVCEWVQVCQPKRVVCMFEREKEKERYSFERDACLGTSMQDRERSGCERECERVWERRLRQWRHSNYHHEFRLQSKNKC